MALIIPRNKGQGILIGNEVLVFVQEIAGDVVKIGVEAPSSMKINRREQGLPKQEVKQERPKAMKEALQKAGYKPKIVDQPAMQNEPDDYDEAWENRGNR